MDKSKMIMFIGVPASGKSTERKEYPNAEVISADDVRNDVFHVQFDEKIEPQVWSLVMDKMEDCLKRKKECLLDATNLKKENRKPFIDMAKKYNATTEAVIFDIPFDVAVKRDAARPKGKIVGHEVMEVMYKNYRDFLKTTSINDLRNEGFKTIKMKTVE